MGTTAYTEEEFKKMIEALFTEKKRVKELEHKLQEAELNELMLNSGHPPVGARSASEDSQESDSDALRAALCEEQAAREALAEQLSSSEMAREELIRDLETLKYRHQQLSDIVAVLKQKFEQGASASSQDNAATELLAVRLELEKIQKEHATSEEAYRLLSMEHASLQLTAATRSDSSEELSFWQKKWADLQEAYENEKNEFASTQEALRHLSLEVEELKDLRQKAVDALPHKDLENQLQETLEDARNAKILVRQYEDKLKTLEYAHASTKEGKTQLELLVEKLKGELSLAKYELSNVQCEVETFNGTSQAFEQDNEELRQQKEADEAAISTLNADLSMTRESLVLAQHRLEAEQAIGAHLRAEIHGFAERFSGLHQEKVELEVVLSSVKSTLKEAEERCDKQNQAIESLEEERCMLRLHTTSLEEQIHGQEKELSSVRQELAVSRSEAVVVIAEVQSTKNALALKLQECLNLERQYAMLKEENTTLISQARSQEPLEGVQQALSLAKMELAQLQGALEQTQLESEQKAEESKKYEEKAKELSEQLEKVSLRMLQAQGSLSEQEKELTQSQQAERTLKAQAARLTNENASLQQTLQDTQDLFKQSRIVLEQQRGEWQVEADSLKTTQRQLEERIKTLVQEIEHHRTQGALLEQKALELGKYQHLSEMARERLQETRLQLQQMQGQNARYKQQIAQTEEDLELRNQEIRSLRLKEESTQQLSSQFQQEVTALTAALAAAKEQITAVEQEASCKQAELAQLLQVIERSVSNEQAVKQEMDRLVEQLTASQQARIAMAQRLEEKEGNISAMQQELDEIKQSLLQGVHEANALKESYTIALQERAYASQQHRQAQLLAKERGERLIAVEDQLQQAKQHQKELQQHLHEMQQGLEKAVEELGHLHADREELQGRLTTLSQEKELLDQVLLQKELERQQQAEAHEDLLEELEAKAVHWTAQKERDTAALQEEHSKALRQERMRSESLIEERERVAEEAKQAWQESMLKLQHENRLILESVENKSSELELMAKRVHETERVKDQMAEECRDLTQRAERLHQQVQEAQKSLEERDSRMRLAQQHLAKKVKEGTILQERLDLQRAEFVELQNQLNAQKARVNELEGNLRLQQQHDDKLQTMVQERVRAAETQAAQWQEKYFALQDSWQSTKSRLAELERLQAEYEQMQSLFSNLKTMMGAPVGMSAPKSNAMISSFKPAPSFAMEAISSEAAPDKEVHARAEEPSFLSASTDSFSEENDSLFSTVGVPSNSKPRTTLFEG